jgi:hypothetical protein
MVLGLDKIFAGVWIGRDFGGEAGPTLRSDRDDRVVAGSKKRRFVGCANEPTSQNRDVGQPADPSAHEYLGARNRAN